MVASQFDKPRVLYGLKPDPVDAEYPRVEFLQCVEGWEPKMQVIDFL